MFLKSPVREIDKVYFCSRVKSNVVNFTCNKTKKVKRITFDCGWLFLLNLCKIECTIFLNFKNPGHIELSVEY